MKNTLEHEIELLGRSVSVLLIAGLLVVGGASAALLNSFGEITGEAEVDQAVTLNGGNWDDEVVASYDTAEEDSFVAGNEFTDRHVLENNAEQAVDVKIVATKDADLGGINVDVSEELEEFSGTENYFEPSNSVLRIEFNDGTTVQDVIDSEPSYQFATSEDSESFIVPNINIHTTETSDEEFSEENRNHVYEAWGYEQEVNSGESTTVEWDDLNPNNDEDVDSEDEVDFVEVRLQAGLAGGQPITPEQLEAVDRTTESPETGELVLDEVVTLQSGVTFAFQTETEFEVSLTPGTYNVDYKVLPPSEFSQ